MEKKPKKLDQKTAKEVKPGDKVWLIFGTDTREFVVVEQVEELRA